MVEFLAFWSPDGHSDCKLPMKMALGRLGAPGPKTAKVKRWKAENDPWGGIKVVRFLGF